MSYVLESVFGDLLNADIDETQRISSVTAG
jgi:hypothetical protein